MDTGRVSKRAVFVALFVLAAALLLHAWIRAAQTDRIVSVVDTFSRVFTTKLEEQIRNRIQIAELIRNDWESGRIRDLDEFETRANIVHDAFDDVQALNWISARGIIERVTPREGNVAALGIDITRRDVAARTLRLAARSDGLRVTPPLELAQGGTGFVGYAPIRIDGDLVGYINLVFRSEPLVEYALGAENVRDFAFASSRKFIWDAWGHNVDGQQVMAMSYWPNEGEPLWSKYSTHAIVHTLDVYSKYTFRYPYPTAISVNGPVYGMEYPMICFNGPRPEEDGTYSKRTKYGLISVIIHEVGHNFFPMIVNSDERQWTWMDEGLNTFLQYITEQEFERNYPSRRGEPRKIVDYMKGDKSEIVPIMSNSELILQFGNNAYGKPATALNILRETVMGRELFDYAFKTYAQRWKFKHPTPADFFRTMEDASAVDLDWFWRGWFYSTDHVDIAIEDVKWLQIDTRDPEENREYVKRKREFTERSISDRRNEKEIDQTRAERKPELQDFYTDYDESEVDAVDREEHRSYRQELDEEQKALLDSARNFYQVTFVNEGGIVMPLILRLTYKDGDEEWRKIPAEIWQKNNKKVNKVIVTNEPVEEIALDPYQQTADTDLEDNYWPPRRFPSRFEIFEKREDDEENAMQRDERAEDQDG